MVPGHTSVRAAEGSAGDRSRLSGARQRKDSAGNLLDVPFKKLSCGGKEREVPSQSVFSLGLHVKQSKELTSTYLRPRSVVLKEKPASI